MLGGQCYGGTGKAEQGKGNRRWELWFSVLWSRWAALFNEKLTSWAKAQEASDWAVWLLGTA